MAKRYEELTFSDDFMYEKVTRDLSLTKKLMEMATEEKIENLQFAENQKTLDEAVEEVRENKKWRAEYMHTLVHEQDIRDEGIAIGIEQGIERGIERGIEQGIEQGRNDERITIVINAINSGMTESEIVSKLCIPQETIDAAKAEMDSNK